MSSLRRSSRKQTSNNQPNYNDNTLDFVLDYHYKNDSDDENNNDNNKRKRRKKNINNSNKINNDSEMDDNNDELSDSSIIINRRKLPVDHLHHRKTMSFIRDSRFIKQDHIEVTQDDNDIKSNKIMKVSKRSQKNRSKQRKKIDQDDNNNNNVSSNFYFESYFPQSLAARKRLFVKVSSEINRLPDGSKLVGEILTMSKLNDSLSFEEFCEEAYIKFSKYNRHHDININEEENQYYYNNNSFDALQKLQDIKYCSTSLPNKLVQKMARNGGFGKLNAPQSNLLSVLSYNQSISIIKNDIALPRYDLIDRQPKSLMNLIKRLGRKGGKAIISGYTSYNDDKSKSVNGIEDLGQKTLQKVWERNHTMFLVKWKGRGHIHSTWVSRGVLEDCHQDSLILGYRKRNNENEIKNIRSHYRKKNPISNDDYIQYILENNIFKCHDDAKLLLKCAQIKSKVFHKRMENWPEKVCRNCSIEKIIDCRNVDYEKRKIWYDCGLDRDILAMMFQSNINYNLDIEPYEYLVKWKHNDYEMCTWEIMTDILALSNGIKSLIDFHRRSHLLSKYPKIKSTRKITRCLVYMSKEDINHQFNRDGNHENDQRPATIDDCFHNGLKLRSYQVEGVNWLCFNWLTKRNSILADEMGLGKTIQTVAMLRYFILKCNRVGPYLIVVPLSTINFWAKEFEEWCGSEISVLTYNGNKDSRKVIRDYEFEGFSSEYKALRKHINYIDYNNNDDSINEITNDYVKKFGKDIKYLFSSYTQRQTKSPKDKPICLFNVMITSYATLIGDLKYFRRFQWQGVIIDEAHRLKNDQSSLFTSLQSLNIKNRVLLTGTPIQNNIQELWSLLHFVDEDNFDDKSAFVDKYGDVKNVKQVEELYDILKPYCLRRLKSDVEKKLPPKDEVIVEVQLTQIQQQLYRDIYEKNLSILLSVNKASLSSLHNISLQLRKICIHPYLFDGIEDTLIKDINDADDIMKKLIDSSGKFKLLDKLLPKLLRENHRVIMFSQWTKVLDILEDFLGWKKYQYERIDGSTHSYERQLAIDRFNAPNSESFCFLLSTRAGGVGITLTSADTVIIVDSDWNLQNDLQAAARVHRIGQEKAVMIYRLLTPASYEMEMFRRACEKLTLDQAVLESISTDISNDNNNDRSGVNKDEIERMLKYGAYDVFRKREDELKKNENELKKNEDELKKNEIVDDQLENIDDLLKHSTVIHFDQNNTKEGSAFAKATFVTHENNDIDWDDPKFWEKLGLQAKVEENNDEDEQLSKRTRRKPARFSGVLSHQEFMAAMNRKNVPFSSDDEDEANDEDSKKKLSSPDGVELDDDDDDENRGKRKKSTNTNNTKKKKRKKKSTNNDNDNDDDIMITGVKIKRKRKKRKKSVAYYNWRQYFDSFSGQFYYNNVATGETVWYLPDDVPYVSVELPPQMQYINNCIGDQSNLEAMNSVLYSSYVGDNDELISANNIPQNPLLLTNNTLSSGAFNNYMSAMQSAINNNTSMNPQPVVHDYLSNYMQTNHNLTMPIPSNNGLSAANNNVSISNMQSTTVANDNPSTTNMQSTTVANDNPSTTNMQSTTVANNNLLTANIQSPNDNPSTTNIQSSNDNPPTSNIQSSNDNPPTSNMQSSNDNPPTSNVQSSNDNPPTSNMQSATVANDNPPTDIQTATGLDNNLVAFIEGSSETNKNLSTNIQSAAIKNMSASIQPIVSNNITAETQSLVVNNDSPNQIQLSTNDDMTKTIESSVNNNQTQYVDNNIPSANSNVMGPLSTNNITQSQANNIPVATFPSYNNLSTMPMSNLVPNFNYANPQFNFQPNLYATTGDAPNLQINSSYNMINPANLMNMYNNNINLNTLSAYSNAPFILPNQQMNMYYPSNIYQTDLNNSDMNDNKNKNNNNNTQ